MTMIATIDVVKTERGATFDICRGDDGLVYLRLNEGGNEITPILTDEEARKIGRTIYKAALHESER
jgi:hypothetical protein